MVTITLNGKGRSRIFIQTSSSSVIRSCNIIQTDMSISYCIAFLKAFSGSATNHPELSIWVCLWLGWMVSTQISKHANACSQSNFSFIFVSLFLWFGHEPSIWVGWFQHKFQHKQSLSKQPNL